MGTLPGHGPVWVVNGGGVGVAPAAMFIDRLSDGHLDFPVDGFVTLEYFDDGEVDDGPEFDLFGGVSGIGGDEDDLVIGGQFGEAMGLERGVHRFSLFEPDGAGKQDPVFVDGEVGDGE